MFLSNITGDKTTGKAVLHLIENPVKETSGYLQTCTLYRVPCVDKSAPINARTLLPQIQGFLRDLGHTATVFRHRKHLDLDSYIEYNEEVDSTYRFVDLSSTATLDVAKQIKERLIAQYDKVDIVNKNGRYTIAAAKIKR